MQNLNQWAIRWGVPYLALEELRMVWGETARSDTALDGSGDSESATQAEARLLASEAGAVSWRNNSGALPDENGRIVRYGLANESKAQNERIKSSDLILVIPRVVTQEMVGTTIGQFGAVECKERGWRYTGTKRETAQLAFGQGVIAKGGFFRFYAGGPLLP